MIHHLNCCCLVGFPGTNSRMKVSDWEATKAPSTQSAHLHGSPSSTSLSSSSWDRSLGRKPMIPVDGCWWLLMAVRNVRIINGDKRDFSVTPCLSMLAFHGRFNIVRPFRLVKNGNGLWTFVEESPKHHIGLTVTLFGCMSPIGLLSRLPKNGVSRPPQVLPFRTAS